MMGIASLYPSHALKRLAMVPTPYVSIAPVDGLAVIGKLTDETEAAHRSFRQQGPLGCNVYLIFADHFFPVDDDACPAVPQTADFVAHPTPGYFFVLLRARYRKRG
jgi:hypothetical protein